MRPFLVAGAEVHASASRVICARSKMSSFVFANAAQSVIPNVGYGAREGLEWAEG
jgi:hypothetical protein